MFDVQKFRKLASLKEYINKENIIPVSFILDASGAFVLIYEIVEEIELVIPDNHQDPIIEIEIIEEDDDMDKSLLEYE